MWKAGILSRERMKVRVMTRFHRLFQGLTGDEIEQFLGEAYNQLKIFFNPLVLDELRTVQKDGFYTVLLSGAYAGLVRAVGKDLGFDWVAGVDLPLREGVFDHRQRIPLIDGQVKLALLQQHLSGREVDWSASRSYGDSYDDRPVMDIVGHPVAVNAEPRLAAYARANNWRML